MRHPLGDSLLRGVVKRRFGASRAAAIVVLLLIVSMPALGGHIERAHADATDPDGEGTLSVEVTDGTTPSPSPSPLATRSSSPAPSQLPIRSGSSAAIPVTTGTATVAIIADPVAADDALVDAEVIDGVLAISGLTIRAAPWIDVGNGSLTVDFVIRNLSSTAFDSTAEFWVDNALGGRIAEIDGVEVSGLQPDETRRVQVRFEGLGQHMILHLNAMLTPPTTLDGVTLETISRNSSLLVPPWFSIALIPGIGLLGWASWRYLRRRQPVVQLQPA